MTHYIARIANAGDHRALVALLHQAVTEQGEGNRIDLVHSQLHIAEKLEKGTCFVVEENGEIIGAITTNPVDLGNRLATEAIEVMHTFVRRDRRNYKAIAALFDAVEAHADHHSLAIFFHELNFPAALRGEVSDGARVEKLYKFRRYVGPVGASYVRSPPSSPDERPPYRHVGRTYLYTAGMRTRQGKKPPVVQRPPKNDDDGNGE